MRYLPGICRAVACWKRRLGIGSGSLFVSWLCKTAPGQVAANQLSGERLPRSAKKVKPDFVSVQISFRNAICRPLRIPVTQIVPTGSFGTASGRVDFREACVHEFHHVVPHRGDPGQLRRQGANDAGMSDILVQEIVCATSGGPDTLRQDAAVNRFYRGIRRTVKQKQRCPAGPCEVNRLCEFEGLDVSEGLPCRPVEPGIEIIRPGHADDPGEAVRVDPAGFWCVGMV